MIFETDEGFLSTLKCLAYLPSFHEIDSVLQISTVSSNEVLLSVKIHQVWVQYKHKVRVEREGSAEVYFHSLYNALAPMREETSSYRFISNTDLGCMTVSLDAGTCSFLISPVKKGPVEEDQRVSFAEIDQEDIAEAWRHLNPVITEDTIALSHVISIQEQGGKLLVKATDGNTILAQCPLKASPLIGLHPTPMQIPAKFFKILANLEGNPRVRLLIERGTKDMGTVIATTGNASVSTAMLATAFPSFERALREDSTDIHLVVLTSTFQNVVRSLSDECECEFYLRSLGEGKTKIEETFPQILDQDYSGVLTLGNQWSVHDILVPFATNFTPCSKSVNMKDLHTLVKDLKSEALLLQFPPEENTKPLVIRETGKSKDQLYAISFILD